MLFALCVLGLVNAAFGQTQPCGVPNVQPITNRIVGGQVATPGSWPWMVVDWLCLVLDAHITQFVLSPDSHMCILKLKSVVNEQMNFFDGLITLEALLEQFKARSLFPQEKKMGQYCIEALHVY